MKQTIFFFSFLFVTTYSFAQDVTKVEINCKSKTMGDRAFFNYDGFNANGKQISEHQIKQYELITKPDMSPPPFSNQGKLLEGICQTFKFNKE